jgi:hypothetical protein
MASLFDVPPEPTSGLQTFAIFITFFFPALALVVIVIRDAGRLATRQFGLGTSMAVARPPPRASIADSVVCCEQTTGWCR